MNKLVEELKGIIDSIALEDEQRKKVAGLLAKIDKSIRVLEFSNERSVLQKRTLTALLNQTSIDLESAMQELDVERQKSENLLLNILPEVISERLKNGEALIADNFEEVSLLFADIVNFTSLASNTSPEELLQILNTIFSAFDEMAEKHNLEKIKTIGDAYMVVGGLPGSGGSHLVSIARMALDMLAISNTMVRPDGAPLRIRIGIHFGPVIAGVIGKKKFSYDLWGDTVNTASRMEHYGEAGKVHVTEAVYERLKGAFEFEPRSSLFIKGKGYMQTYFLGSERSLSPL